LKRAPAKDRGFKGSLLEASLSSRTETRHPTSFRLFRNPPLFFGDTRYLEAAKIAAARVFGAPVV
jgi:hypothetical protein